MNWPLLALGSMLGGAFMLLRSAPVSPAWFALPLLLLPWSGRWRSNVLVMSCLLAWIAFSFQQHWEQRVAQPLNVNGISGWVEAELSRRQNSVHFAWRVDHVDHELDKRLIRVAWYRDAPKIEPGQCWRLDLRIRPPRGSTNPGGMDYAAWLFREAYAAKANVRSGQSCGLAAQGLRQRWRSQFADQLSAAGIGTRAAATVSALLLGDRSAMQSTDWDVLRRTGTSHLFAISGLHLGLIAALGWFLGRWLWSLVLYRCFARRRDVAALLAALFALIYAWMSGFALPVQRALIMCIVGLAILLGGRANRPFELLALAWVIVLAMQPLSLMMPGLWMSFIAVFGILVYLQRFASQPWWLQLLGIQLSLSLLLLPIGMLLFGGASVYSAAVNLVLVPVFSVLLPALLGATLLLQFGCQWPIDLLGRFLDGIWTALEFVSAQSMAYLQPQSPGLLLSALACALIVALLLWPGRAVIARAILLTLFAACCLWPRSQAIAAGELSIWFFDVGQGQSVLLQTQNHSLLYDAGPAWPGGFDAGASIVVPSLRQLGVSALDALVISHGDSDHAGGSQAVLEALPVKQHWGYRAQQCRAREAWVWDAVRFEWLHPGEDMPSNDNNQSCVLLISNAHGRRLLLAGDIEASVERELLRREDLGFVDVLSVPHHGSSSSSSKPWVERLRPTLAVVQAGYDNRWKHPSAKVRRRYQDVGSQLYNTGDYGALRVHLGAELELNSQRQLQPRLWHFYPDGHDARQVGN